MKTLAQDLQQGKRLEAQNIAIILYFTLRKQRVTFIVCQTYVLIRVILTHSIVNSLVIEFIVIETTEQKCH